MVARYLLPAALSLLATMPAAAHDVGDCYPEVEARQTALRQFVEHIAAAKAQPGLKADSEWRRERNALLLEVVLTGDKYVVCSLRTE